MLELPAQTLGNALVTVKPESMLMSKGDDGVLADVIEFSAFTSSV